MLTDRELEQITAKLVADFTGRVDRHRKQYRDAFDFFSDGVPLGIDPNRDLLITEKSFSYPKSMNDVNYVVDHYAQSIRRLEDELATSMFSQETRLLAARVAEGKVEMPCAEWFNENDDAWHSPPTVAFAQICSAVILGLIESYRAEMERVQGRRTPSIEAAVAIRVEQAKPKKKLCDLWESYKKDRLAVKSWAPSTLAKYEGFFSVFLDILGDCEIVAFEEDGAAADFIENLQKYPRGKNQITSPYRGKPFSPLWSMQPGFKGLQRAQLNDMLIQLCAWFEYALETPKVWGLTHNPLKGRRLPETESDRKPKSAYTSDEIVKLIAGLMKQRPLVQPERFWVPLIGLLSGARISEICQLHVADIKNAEGLWHFHFRHEPEALLRTKGRKSRHCPIHPTLISLGFVDYVSKQQAAGSTLLFSNLKPFKGKWSQFLGKWYNETFEPKFISSAADKSFHSTRHSFISWFKANSEMSLHNLSVLKSIVGHLDNIDRALIGINLDHDMTWGEKNYGDRHSLKVQYALLKKLNYGVDFSCLKARLK
ncbi:site-specific integrase [Geomonas oryzae]|uniref:site-specific integrase n=1 Tax=Geomonas oryzae TaxID=2364273 RepID=UPI00100A2B9D|nr:site-specific integrase [Geomonas oryzae]